MNELQLREYVKHRIFDLELERMELIQRGDVLFQESPHQSARIEELQIIWNILKDGLK